MSKLNIKLASVCKDCLQSKELKKHRDHLAELVIEHTQELRRTNEEHRQFIFARYYDLQEPFVELQAAQNFSLNIIKIK